MWISFNSVMATLMLGGWVYGMYEARHPFYISNWMNPRVWVLGVIVGAPFWSWI